MAQLLDGKACSKAIEAELKTEIEESILHPKLVILLVGNHADSKTYVKLKKNACGRAGIEAQIREIDASVEASELRNLIESLNDDSTVHGILLQLPLPEHLQSHEEELLHSIRSEKDVDGLHPTHFHRLGQPDDRNRHVFFPPCTAAGCIEILLRNGVVIDGKDVVIIGRGKLVGLPLSLMLLQRNATVTTCHTHTKDLKSKVARADIVVVATGQPELVKGDWVKEGAVVIDVGINYIDDPKSKKGYRIVGDVAFDEVKDHAAAITPVPGGIGPMTIAMLLRNVVTSAKYASSKQ